MTSAEAKGVFADPPVRSAELRHFLDLVEHGRHLRTCSSGARRARLLAECLVENLPGLDASATDGLSEFAALCIGYPISARELIGD
jgi:hypothetical protein